MAGPAPTELSIIIVNWNSIGFVRACLRTIYESNCSFPLEVIVVDNNSPEGGLETLRPEFPQAQLIASKTNLGFAGANNVGFRNSSGKYLLFLNPDTEVLDGALETMVNAAKAIPDAGVLGCHLLNTDLSIQITAIQTFPTIFNQLLDSEWIHRRWPDNRMWYIGPLFRRNGAPVPVEVISGACMLLRRDVFEEAGMFTEDYFMYAEDLDLCYKVAKLGRRNYYIEDAEIIHHGGKSTSKKSFSQWPMIMKLNAVQKFCEKTRGPFYGHLYGFFMGLAATVRLVLITLGRIAFFRRPDRDSLEQSQSKWWAVLRWATGQEIRQAAGK